MEEVKKVYFATKLETYKGLSKVQNITKDFFVFWMSKFCLGQIRDLQILLQQPCYHLFELGNWTSYSVKHSRTLLNMNKGRPAQCNFVTVLVCLVRSKIPRDS